MDFTEGRIFTRLPGLGMSQDTIRFQNNLGHPVKCKTEKIQYSTARHMYCPHCLCQHTYYPIVYSENINGYFTCDWCGLECMVEFDYKFY